MSLISNFTAIKSSLPKGKLSRWDAIRFLFGTTAAIHWLSKRAIWEMMDCSEKTRARWQAEYRHQRTLAAITAGRDYKAPLNPCPYCGGEGENIWTHPVEGTDVIRCSGCGAETAGHEPGTGEHIKAWNAGKVLTEEQTIKTRREQGFA